MIKKNIQKNYLKFLAELRNVETGLCLVIWDILMNLYQMRCRKKLEMEAKDMPSYPDSESIKVIDGVVVVKRG